MTSEKWKRKELDFAVFRFKPKDAEVKNGYNSEAQN